MQKFIPKEKLSKKAKRELNALQRKTWNGINPVTRKPENPKAYNRKKLRREDRKSGEAFLFAAEFFDAGKNPERRPIFCYDPFRKLSIIWRLLPLPAAQTALSA
ncbi:MAG: hypothetical protein PUC59_05915 [Firmicutes bacterium]|nr:hypothetical protein [Bacillota bacterium]